MNTYHKGAKNCIERQGYHLLFTPHLPLTHTHTHTPINIKAPNRIQGDLGTRATQSDHIKYLILMTKTGRVFLKKIDCNLNTES